MLKIFVLFSSFKNFSKNAEMNQETFIDNIFTEAPFINQSKLQFLLKRLLRTFLGGLALYFNQYVKVPCFIYSFQLFLFILPFAVSAPFALLHSFLHDHFSHRLLSILVGSVYLILIFGLNLTSLIITNRFFKRSLHIKLSTPNKPLNMSSGTCPASVSSSASIKIKLNKKRRFHSLQESLTSFNEEQDYEFYACCSVATLAFVLPPVGIYYEKVCLSNIQCSKENFVAINWLKLCAYLIRISLDSALAGLLMFCSVQFLSIVYLQSFFSLGGAIVIFILNWISFMIAFYSLTIRHPLEPAIYLAYDRFNIQHYHRTFYLLLCLLLEFPYK